MVTIAITGGGTGGHIYPGIAVASSLQKIMPCRIIWIGSASRKVNDRAIVAEAKIPFYGVPSGKLRRYASLENCGDLFKVLAGFFAARRVLKKETPGLLFSKGGFVSVPPCAAAASLGIPVFTHESDYSPGLATKLNSRFAEKIFVPYPKTASFFQGAQENKVELSGNPIRPEFAAASSAKGRAFLGLGEKDRILLVLGGSLGSREINRLVEASLPELTRHYIVVHQTGNQDEAGRSPVPGSYLPFAYFREELPHIIAAAELVLCRSGAGTIWECASLGKPMVLVPLREGSRGDQVENARVFEEAGAAVVTGENVSPESLAETIAALARNAERRSFMGEAVLRFGAAGAADRIARAIAVRLGFGIGAAESPA